MRIVKVTYTTQPQYVEKNQANIKKVMDKLEQLARPGLFYHVCLSADGKTFTHTAFFQSDEDSQALLGLEVFKEFQEQLKAHGPESPPKQEILTLVGSSKTIFNS